MTREPVTCACGAVLKDSYPSAISAHGETKRHVAWVTAKYEPDQMPGDDGPDLLPQGAPAAQRNDESAGEYLRRLEYELGKAYDAFVSTDAGQQLIEQAAVEDKEARKQAAKSEIREKILAAKERERQAILQRQAGPVVIVQPPTNGKPTKAARAAGVKAPPKEKPMPKRTYTIEEGKLVPPAVDGINRPLKIGTTPIDIGDGVKRYPILHRNGDIAAHQADNYIWKCPVDGKRIRAATCPQHPDQKAPQGYRADDRIVK